MAEAKFLADQVDKQTKVIEEAIGRRDARKEDLVTACIKLEHLPLEPLPAPKVSPAMGFLLCVGCLVGAGKDRQQQRSACSGRQDRPLVEGANQLGNTSESWSQSQGYRSGTHGHLGEHPRLSHSATDAKRTKPHTCQGNRQWDARDGTPVDAQPSKGLGAELWRQSLRG
eukprot:1238706-Amphidinium_carterae.1